MRSVRSSTSKADIASQCCADGYCLWIWNVQLWVRKRSQRPPGYGHLLAKLVADSPYSGKLYRHRLDVRGSEALGTVQSPRRELEADITRSNTSRGCRDVFKSGQRIMVRCNPRRSRAELKEEFLGKELLRLVVLVLASI